MIKTLLPSRSHLLCETSKTFSIISLLSGNLPIPLSLPVNRPIAGSITKIPRDFKVSTFATVAGLSHICGCIAGINKMGAVVVKTVFVKRSSARPAAIREIKSAVAGAINTKSAFTPSDTCGTVGISSQTSVLTFLPERASQVALPTKFKLEGVGTTVTKKP
ncbi:unannotated protein [freshwater metagenome]|uniref:Unannotated protein n=1 Tax=freshwater metagenome TaxID=449393 RepID=A0A6J6Y5P4_9ZZZZ